MHRTGQLAPPSRQEAVDRVQAWANTGHSRAWIGSACGISPDAIADILHGTHAHIGRNTIRAILTADISTATAGFTATHGATRRLQALAWLGHTCENIAAATGQSTVTIAYHQRGAGTRINPTLWAAIANHYAATEHTPGSSDLARTRAIRRGWAPPAAWDDIDNPTEQPDVGQTVRPGALVEDIAWLLRHDPATTSAHLAHRLGLSTGGIDKALRRHGRADLLTQLTRNAENINPRGKTA